MILRRVLGSAGRGAEAGARAQARARPTTARRSASGGPTARCGASSAAPPRCRPRPVCDPAVCKSVRHCVLRSITIELILFNFIQLILKKYGVQRMIRSQLNPAYVLKYVYCACHQSALNYCPLAALFEARSYYVPFIMCSYITETDRARHGSDKAATPAPI